MNVQRCRYYHIRPVAFDPVVADPFLMMRSEVPISPFVDPFHIQIVVSFLRPLVIVHAVPLV